MNTQGVLIKVLSQIALSKVSRKEFLKDTYELYESGKKTSLFYPFKTKIFTKYKSKYPEMFDGTILKWNKRKLDNVRAQIRKIYNPKNLKTSSKNLMEFRRDLEKTIKKKRIVKKLYHKLKFFKKNIKPSKNFTKKRKSNYLYKEILIGSNIDNWNISVNVDNWYYIKSLILHDVYHIINNNISNEKKWLLMVGFLQMVETMDYKTQYYNIIKIGSITKICLDTMILTQEINDKLSVLNSTYSKLKRSVEYHIYKSKIQIFLFTI